MNGITVLVLREGTNEVIGYQSGGVAKPPDGNGKRYVEVTDAECAQWRAAAQVASSARHGKRTIWDDGSRTVGQPADEREEFSIEVEGGIIDLSANSPITLNVTCVSDPSYTGPVVFDLDSRRIQVSMVNGSGTKVLSAPKSGRWLMTSTSEYRLTSNIEIEAVE